MSLMNEVLNVDGLDLLTDDEREFNKVYVEKLRKYADGEVDGVQIKALTAGASTIAKRQQSRSAVAVLKWNMARGGEKITPQIEDKKS